MLTYMSGQKYKIWLTWGIYDRYGRESNKPALTEGMIKESDAKELEI